MNFIEALPLFFVFNCLLFWLITSFNFGPGICEGERRKVLLTAYMLLIPTFSIFLTLSTSSIILQRRNIYWAYFAGASILVTVTCILVLARNNIVRTIALLLPLTVITTSLFINGFVPLASDEGRYAGFASKIIQDGKWTPFKYSENTYYQYFHLLPSLNAILSIITGASPIYAMHPTLVLHLAILTILTIYAIVRRVLWDSLLQKLANLVFIILLATPPISSLALLPRSIATTIYLSVFLSSLVSLNARTGLQFYVPIIIMILVGILSHAIFSVLLSVSFTLILILMKIYKTRETQISILKETLKLVMVCTTAYWTYTLITDQIVNTGKLLYESFIDLLNVEIKPSRAESPWYSSLPSEFAYPWTLLPSLATVFIIKKLMQGNRKFSRKDCVEVGLGFSGLSLLLCGFIARMAIGGLGAYFYISYFLLIPPSIELLGKIVQKRKLLSIGIMVGVILISAFYGIQDPAYSPDIHRIMLTADKRSWSVAETLVTYLPSHIEVIGGPISGRKFYTDQRVAIGLSALMLEKSYLVAENMPKEEIIFVVGTDELGIRWVEKRLPTNVWGIFNKVFSDGLYDAYLIKKSYASSET
jgi:hypothetical protein